VSDNITLWDESVSDAEVYRAASDACIHEYIASLDGAYDYLLSENGSNLSGGQRQRLEIARALLYNPSIVLLDEATSAIDPVNRKIIEENLIKRGCACIVVTHILSQVTDYDEIIVMEKGAIIQRGAHEELMRTSPFYASTYEKERPAASI
jgi:ABC-type bacteriocin/lantibiotic exporter with double-glycine peptidase domain